MNCRTMIIIVTIVCGFLGSVAYGDVYVWLDSKDTKHISNVRPEWWTEEMDQMDPGTVIAPEGEFAEKGKFIGDRENKKFHWPQCEQIYNPEGQLAIPEHKRIWFDTYEQAIRQGYHVCDHCKPSADGPEYKPKTP